MKPPEALADTAELAHLPAWNVATASVESAAGGTPSAHLFHAVQAWVASHRLAFGECYWQSTSENGNTLQLVSGELDPGLNKRCGPKRKKDTTGQTDRYF